MAHKTDLGTVQIHNEVIGTIASLAAQEVPGVIDIWRGVIPTLGRWAGKSGVRVEIRDQEVRVWMSLVAEYGVSLPQIATQVQERVREMIERMTHLMATEIHVGIHHVKTKENSHPRKV